MLILGIDTSGKQGSVALARCSTDLCEIIEIVELTGGAFSAQLVPRIAALLSGHALRPKNIDAFAVASGPGSFTGLRVGLAAVKALAEVLRVPIAAVSVLETLAVISGAKGRVLAVLDAGRNEVYVGEYELSAEAPRKVSEQLLSREQS